MMETYKNSYGVVYVCLYDVPPVEWEVSRPEGTKSFMRPFGHATGSYTTWIIRTPNGGLALVEQYDNGQWSFGQGYFGCHPSVATKDEVFALAARWAWAKKEGYQVCGTRWWKGEPSDVIHQCRPQPPKNIEAY